MRVILPVLALGFALSVQLGRAQGVMQLSLKRAVDIALTPEGSARVALAEQSIRVSETRLNQARSAFFPNIDGSVEERSQTVNLQSFGFDFRIPIPGFSIPSIVGPFGVFDARANAQQTVLDFTTIRKYQASRTGLQAARADLDVTKDQVSEQVARAYLASLREDAALETARANVELSQALERLAQSQKDAGTGTGIEVTRAQVQLANDRQRLTVAENDRRRTVLQLLRAMGLSLNMDVQLSDMLAYQPVDTAAVEALLETARKGRSDLKAQAQHEQTARMNFAAVEAERLPSIAAFGDYGTIGRELIGAHPTHTVGIQLKVPVFDGGRRSARREESLAEYRQEEIRTRDLGLQVDLDVRLALDSLRSAASQVETARQGLTLAQSELEQAQRRYQAGVANSLEVTDAQTRLDRARANQVDALYNHNLARLELAAATGAIQEYVQK
ncbi:MAG: outer rane efflux protein [Bryobacterales bacterium]|nr:outer rane efflux protein [Bryobacterales bacterium]